MTKNTYGWSITPNRIKGKLFSFFIELAWIEISCIGMQFL